VNGEARTIIDRRESGALCGELELLAGQYRIASAVTLRDSKLGPRHRKCAFEQCIRASQSFSPHRGIIWLCNRRNDGAGSRPCHCDAYGPAVLPRQASGARTAVVVVQVDTAAARGLCRYRRETVGKILWQLKKTSGIQSRSGITILRPLLRTSNTHCEKSRSADASASIDRSRKRVAGR